MDAIRLCCTGSIKDRGATAWPSFPPPHDLDEATIRGFIFEAPGVLYDATLWRRWLLKLLARMGLHTHYEIFYAIWDREYAPDVYAGRCGYGAALVSFLRSVGLTPALIDEIIPAVRARRKMLEADEHPLPHAVATLHKLVTSGYAVAVTADTECTQVELRNKLERFGLDRHLPNVTTSIDLQCAKPDPAAYLAAADAMQLPPHHVAYVDCHAEHLAGARDLGMKVIALNCSETTDADWHIAGLPQLLTLAPDATAMRRAAC